MNRETLPDLAVTAVHGWLRDPVPEHFPYGPVLGEIQTIGKHFLAQELLAALDQARAGCRTSPLLPFLDCALDKRDARYSYRSYLCLPLLEGLTVSTDLLIADALRYELAAERDDPPTLPEVRPDAAVQRKRLRYGLRLLGADTLPPAPADPAVAEHLRLSMQPVYVLHDEYLFIRVLQSYEAVFTALVRHVRSARDLLRHRQPDDAVAALTLAADQLDRVGLLFSLLATMDVDAFRRFRRYTEGSSAIQSEQYKRFECLCGSPQEHRWLSPAFRSAPMVAVQAVLDPDTITRAYLAARDADAFTAAQWSALDAALTRLEHSHQSWKTTHHSLAARMIGDATGSGSTSGVPYLRDCLGNRLFWRLGERYLPGSRAVT